MKKILHYSCAALVAQLPLLGATIFKANLTPDQEVTAPIFTTEDDVARPASFGTATLILADDLSSLTITATIYNIDVNGNQTPDDFHDNLRAAHIHGPAGFGQNAGVKWGFIGMPFNDDNPTDTVLTPFATGVGGVVTTKWDAPEGQPGFSLTTLLNDLNAGLLYLNFHTEQNPGGEIRGQILHTPDGGASGILLGGSLVALASLGLRRK